MIKGFISRSHISRWASDKVGSGFSPHSRANISAPRPSKKVCSSCCINRLAILTGRKLFTPATAPQFRLLPSIKAASSSIMPRRLGNPPYPKESSVESCSSTRTASSITSSLLCPMHRSRVAFSRPCPLSETRKKNFLMLLLYGRAVKEVIRIGNKIRTYR